MKDEALAYLNGGLFPYPCHLDKTPAIRDMYSQEYSIDNVSTWFGRKDRNIAFYCKDIVVVDVDLLDPKYNDSEGMDYCFNLLNTPYKVMTKRGFHAYYRKSKTDIGLGENGVQNYVPGVDILTGRKSVTAPPSTVNGHLYIWAGSPITNIKDLPFLDKKTLSGLKKIPSQRENIDVMDMYSILQAYGTVVDHSIFQTHINCPLPNHTDTNPSFRLNTRKHNLFHCSCAPLGGSGDAVQFVAMMEEWLKPGETYKGRPDVAKKAIEKIQSFDIHVPEKELKIVERDGLVHGLNQDHFFLARGNGMIYKEIDDGLTQMTIGGFKTTYSNQRVLVGKKDFGLGDVFLTHEERRTYDKIVFKPFPYGEAVDIPSEHYNSFTKWPLIPKEGQDFMFIVEHIVEVVANGNEALADWLIDWFAHIFQYPATKPRTAIVLYSLREGTGKGSLIRAIALVMKHLLLETDNHSFLDGKFKSYMLNVLLVAGNEVLWGGEKKIQGAIMNFITEPTMEIEEKFGPKYIVDSCHRFLVQTNNMWAIPLGDTDRRWTVFELSNDRVKDQNYFNKFYKRLEKKGLGEQLFHFFLTREIKHNISIPFKTEAKEDAKAMDLDPLHLWWHEVLDSGIIELPDRSITRKVWDGSYQSVRTLDLFMNWLDWSRNRHNKITKPDGKFAFSKAIRKFIPCEDTEDGINLKPRGICKEMFMEVFDFQTWPGGDEEEKDQKVIKTKFM